MLIGDLIGIALIFRSVSAILSMVSCDGFSMRLDASREWTHTNTCAPPFEFPVEYRHYIREGHDRLEGSLDPPLIHIGIHDLPDGEAVVCYY